MTTSGTKEWAEHNVNFSKGCSNNCKYCYARRMASRFGWKENWCVMENNQKMMNKKFKKREGTIMTPSSHDITESNIDLAIAVFKNLLKPGNNILIVSKPKQELIEQICQEINPWKGQVLFRFTIGTLNDKVRKKWEPDAPSISDRLGALEYAHKKGWRTSVSVEPFLDDTIIDLVEYLLPFVTDTIWIGPMNKIHVPQILWSKTEDQLYSSENLTSIKLAVDSLNSSKIKYKDHFMTKIDKVAVNPTI